MRAARGIEIGCTALLVLAPPLAAQEASDTAVLHPVIVTATRVPVASAAAAGAATVITGEELRARGVRDLAEAIRQTPGVHLARSGTYGGLTSLFLRGGQSNYVKVLVDGVPVNEAGGAFDFAHLTVDQVERIEIVRGPVGVLYGSDAVSGVVQIFTRAASGAPRATITARAGSVGTRDATADLSAGGPVAWSIGGGRHETDGIHDFNSSYRNTTSAGALGIGAPGRTRLRLTGRYQDALAHFPTDGTGMPVDSNQHRIERRLIGGLEGVQPLGERVEARIHVRASELHATSDDQPDSPGDTLGFYSRVDGRSSRRSVDTRLDVRLRETNMITTGVEIEWQRERNHGASRFARFPESIFEFDERRANRAAYAQAIGTLAPGASYALGYRRDDNERFGDFDTWRAAASRALPLVGELRVAAGTAFREPAFAEQYNTAFSRGNPDLRPERTRSWEIGLTRELLDGATRIGVTYFDQRFQDLIQYIYLDDPEQSNEPNYYNVAAAFARGIELTLERRLFAGLGLSASHTALRTRVTDPGFGAFGAFEEGEPLLRRPKHTTTLALDLARSRWSAHAGATRVGKREDLDFRAFPSSRVTLPAYTTLDLAGRLRVTPVSAAAAASVTLRVENALGERYEAVSGFAAPGRVVLVGGRIDVGG